MSVTRPQAKGLRQTFLFILTITAGKLIAASTRECMMKGDGPPVTMREKIEKQGNWIFRYRSYLPLGLIIMILYGMRDYTYLREDYLINLWWEFFCLFIAFSGLALRIYTIGHVPKGTSGRNTRSQVADVLNTTGIYSVVRNPLYVGNFLIWFAAGLLPRDWWASVAIVTVFYLYHERIVFAEEEYLRRKFGEQYVQWARATPAFIPNFKLWIPPKHDFSLKTVIRRECHGFMGIIATFSLLEAMGNYSVKGVFALDFAWKILLYAGAVLYLLVLLVDRNTDILKEEGRS